MKNLLRIPYLEKRDKQILRPRRLKLPLSAFTRSLAAFTFIVLLTFAGMKLVLAGGQTVSSTSEGAHDPGVRSGAIGSGQPLSNLMRTIGALEFFTNGPT